MSAFPLAHFWSTIRPRRRSDAADPAPALEPDIPRSPTPQWEHLAELLAAALELSSAECGTFLERVEDPALHDELASLIAAHRRETLLDRPPLLAGDATEDDVASSLGARGVHYEVLERVGGGGMGVVYRARDRRLGREVALKFLPPHLSADVNAKERFLLEACAAAALDHPNICTIYESGESEDGQLFLAMPFYAGETLQRRLTRGPLPLAQALDIAAQVATGLDRAHARGIVHRDIKPANLIVTSEGVVKVVDFGVAKLADAGLANPDSLFGTIAYMSPEQATGLDCDGRTDLWSLGVVLYEMLTGRRPFRGEDDRALLDAIIGTEPPAVCTQRHDATPAVEAVVRRALARQREDRFQSASEMQRALMAVRTSMCHISDPAKPNAGAPEPDRATATPFERDRFAGERRQVTIVVASLVNHHLLVDQLSPDDMGRLLGHLRDVSLEVGQRHGGVLNELTDDHLVLLFGVPVAREDDTLRAARAALDLIERATGIDIETAGDARRGVTLRCGLHTGSVVTQCVEDGVRIFRLSGSSPAVAARLAEHAAGGEALVSGPARSRLVAYFEMDERGALALMPHAEPESTYRLRGDTGVRTRLEAAAKLGLTAFTGRDAELQTLRTALDDLCIGVGRVVLVSGEAGLGKSRLLHEFTRLIDPGRITLFVGRCRADGANVAYLPFIDVLRALIDSAPVNAQQRNAGLLASAPALEQYLPFYHQLLAIREPAPPGSPHLHGAAMRLALQEALVALFVSHARRRPTVALFEDWQWADDASREVLRQVSETVDCPLLIVVTTRPDHTGETVVPQGALQLELQPLDPAATSDLLRAVLGALELPSELMRIVRERSGGNPFFVEELCRSLREQGAVQVRQNAALLSGPLPVSELPDSIHGLIRSRLDHLPLAARELLRLAAVVGRDFPHDLLAEAGSTEDLAGTLDLLARAGLIHQPRGAPAEYRFNHILTQEVAYSSLLQHQRRDLHERVGTILERLDVARNDARLDRLAFHFERAESWEKAVRYCILSAERAHRLAQYPDACDVLDRARTCAALLTDASQRKAALIDILLRQERLFETLGDRVRQQQLIDDLLRLLDENQDTAALAECLLRQGDLLTLQKHYAQAEAPLRRSLVLRRTLGDRASERNSLRSLGLLRWHQRLNQEALEFAEQSLRIAREHCDAVAIVADLTSCGAILRALGRHANARAALQEALALSDASVPGPEESSSELTVMHVYALQNLANSYRETGEVERALECLERAGTLATRHRLPTALAYHLTSMAHLHLQEGHIDQSLRCYREAIALTRQARHAAGLAQSLRIFGGVLAALGRHSEALPHLYEAATVFAQLLDCEGELAAHNAIGAGEECVGNYAEALVAWEHAGALSAQLGDRTSELAALEGIARATRRHVSDQHVVLARYERALVHAVELADRVAEGRIRNIIGITEWGRGQHARALAHFEHALDIYQSLNDDAHAGLMQNSIASTLHALGRNADAEETVRRALAAHQPGGRTQLEAHALALLGDLCAERDDHAAATAHYARSLQLRRVISDRRGEGWMLHHLAHARMADAASSDTQVSADAARRDLLAADAIARECGDAELVAACQQLQIGNFG